MINLIFTCKTVQPEIVRNEPFMCTMGWDPILYENYIFKNYRILRVPFLISKTRNKTSHLGVNIWCRYYCLMTASGYYCFILFLIMYSSKAAYNKYVIKAISTLILSLNFVYCVQLSKWYREQFAKGIIH